jgi:hypothetical protein
MRSLELFSVGFALGSEPDLPSDLIHLYQKGAASETYLNDIFHGEALRSANTAINYLRGDDIRPFRWSISVGEFVYQDEDPISKAPNEIVARNGSQRSNLLV